MSFAATQLLALASLAALWLGLGKKRPGLVFLAGALLAAHVLPLLAHELKLSPPLSATLVAQLGDARAIAILASFAWLAGYCLLAQKAPGSGTAPELLPVADLSWLHRSILAIMFALLVFAPGGIAGFAQTGFLRLPAESTLFSITYATACLAAVSTTFVSVAAARKGTAPPFFSIMMVLATFWILGGRTQFLVTLVSFCLVFLAYDRVRLRGLALPFLAAGGLSILTLLFRLNLQGREIDFAGAMMMMAGELSLLDSYAVAARLVDEHGHRAGHYWQTLQQVVPRALVPDKPLQLSRDLRTLVMRDRLGGMTPGLAGEAFVAGGHLAVAAIGLAFGGVLAALDNLYLRLHSLPAHVQTLTLCLLPFLAIFTLRGGLDTAIFRLAIVLASAWLLAVLIRPSRLPLRQGSTP